MDRIMVQLTHSKALQLLQDLEDMNIIRLFKSKEVDSPKLSDKYRGSLTKVNGKKLNKHIDQMRNEWNNS